MEQFSASEISFLSPNRVKALNETERTDPSPVV